MNFDLNSYSKEKQFNVPEGYFDHLSEQIFDAVKADQKRLLFKRRLFYSISIAASICLLLVAGFLFFDLKNGENIDSPIVRTTSAPSVGNDTSNTPEDIQYESLLAQNQPAKSIPNSTEETAPVKLKNKKEQNTSSEINNNNFEEELDDIDYQIIENYSNEIVFNDWWEL